MKWRWPDGVSAPGLKALAAETGGAPRGLGTPGTGDTSRSSRPETASGLPWWTWVTLRGWRSFCTAGGRVANVRLHHHLCPPFLCQAGLDSPSWFMPACRHFFSRQAWHWFRWALSTGQSPAPTWHLQARAAQGSVLSRLWGHPGASIPHSPSPASPVHQPPPHAPLEEATAAVAGIDSIVFPTTAVPAHTTLQLQRGATTCGQAASPSTPEPLAKSSQSQLSPSSCPCAASAFCWTFGPL